MKVNVDVKPATTWNADGLWTEKIEGTQTLRRVDIHRNRSVLLKSDNI